MTFKEAPKSKVTDVRNAVKPFKVDKVIATITRQVVEKDKALMAGDVVLANVMKDGKAEKDVLADVAKLIKDKKDNVKLTGELTEDEKGKVTLALSAAVAVDKK